VSKYVKGKTAPTGNTQFQFVAGSLNFKSTSYDWLVVSGNKAQYEGEGTINDLPGYGFRLTAWDNEGGFDKFRIKIWRLSDGAVVYDNRFGTPDANEVANPQAIASGSIVIHKAK
jgi:hypothetical protein